MHLASVLRKASDWIDQRGARSEKPLFADLDVSLCKERKWKLESLFGRFIGRGSTSLLFGCSQWLAKAYSNDAFFFPSVCSAPPAWFGFSWRRPSMFKVSNHVLIGVSVMYCFCLWESLWAVVIPLTWSVRSNASPPLQAVTTHSKYFSDLEQQNPVIGKIKTCPWSLWCCGRSLFVRSFQSLAFVGVLIEYSTLRISLLVFFFIVQRKFRVSWSRTVRNFRSRFPSCRLQWFFQAPTFTSVTQVKSQIVRWRLSTSLLRVFRVKDYTYTQDQAHLLLHACWTCMFERASATMATSGDSTGKPQRLKPFCCKLPLCSLQALRVAVSQMAQRSTRALQSSFNKIASRSGAPRPPMTDVGTETAFRLDQRKYFRKSKHLLRSEVSWCDLHLRRSTWHCTSE